MPVTTRARAACSVSQDQYRDSPPVSSPTAPAHPQSQASQHSLSSLGELGAGNVSEDGTVKNDTYINYPGVRKALKSINGNSLETSPVYAMEKILSIYFNPPINFFVHRKPHYRSGRDDYFADFMVESMRESQNTLLITEVKRTAFASTQEGFRNILQQLQNGARAITLKQSNLTTPLYGIAVVGKYIRFYEFDRKAKEWFNRPCMDQLKPHEAFHLEKNVALIDTELIQMRKGL